MDNKEITNTELLNSINRSFSRVEDKITNLESKLTTEIQDLRLDLKSFKKDTSDITNKQGEDIGDINETILIQDKRIDKLENKIFI